MASAAADLVRAMVQRGDTAQAVALAQETLALVQGGERAHVLLAAGAAHAAQGRFADALQACVEAGEWFESQGDTAGLCDALSQVGSVLRSAGDHAASVAALRRAEGLARAGSDPLHQARVARNLGVSASMLGRHDEALLQLTRAVALLQTHAPPSEARAARLSLLNARGRRMDGLPPSAARQREGESQLLAWAQLAQAMADAGEARPSAMAWGNHAITLQRLGRTDEAIAALLALTTRYQAYGMRPNEGLAYSELGRCHESLGDPLHAREHFAEAVHILGEAGTQDDLMEALEGLERSEAALGHAAAANEARQRHEALARRRSDDEARQALARPGWHRDLHRLAVQVHSAPGAET